MKKMLVMLFFAFYSLLSYAPVNNFIYIAESKGIKDTMINYYSSLIEALFKLESNRNIYAYNKSENAVGGLQIRQCRIEHYNKLTGKNYTLNDMYDFEKSKEVFLYFAKGKTYEQAAKSWNGSGPKTIKYWDAIKVLLYA